MIGDLVPGNHEQQLNNEAVIYHPQTPIINNLINCLSFTALTYLGLVLNLFNKNHFEN